MLRFLACAALFIAHPAFAQTRGDAELKAQMLAVHNAARAEVRVAPLTWSDTLAEGAKAHAAWMAANNKFEHARTEFGENLWAGTPGAYSYAQMAGAWVAEKRYYVDAPSPKNSSSGNWGDVGHYTQLVWSTTTQVGCATAVGRDFEYLVCRYSPPGNISGRKAY
ncbi:CAP domain-containing protein [Sphingomonas soli]|uniref:CAP domain-containing protein n=1 Tax=Sphingomonas soli TaxID=266127 RepID=UPI00082A8BB7|nr:CAP domain-containing protein [Sphingomonas soli]